MQKSVILSEQTESVQYLARRDKRLAKLMRQVGTVAYTTYDDPFSFVIHEVIEQMLSKKAGAKIYERLEEICGGTVAPDKINDLTFEQVHGIGTSSKKANAIKSVADAVASGKFSFERLRTMSNEDVIKELVQFPGIGQWTAKMYLIFVLDRQDVLPYEDAAFLQSYRWLYKTENLSQESIKKKCKKWKPYSSIASRYLYRALDNGITKNEFHLYK